MRPTSKAAPGRQKRRGIQSVEIGIRVLEALRAGSAPQSLSQLAKAAGLAPSNCHRYLASFLHTGFVSQDLATNRYKFGPRILQAGLAALSQLDPIATGTEALTQLVDSTGCTGLLAIWSDSGAVIIRWMPGRLAVRTTLSAGSTLPLLRSATGRVFLAYLPERQTKSFVERDKSQTEEDPANIVAAVRQRGLAQVSGDYIPGLSAVAAPILDANGDAAAAICLVGLSEGFSRSAIRRLKEATGAASVSLGWREESIPS